MATKARTRRLTPLLTTLLILSVIVYFSAPVLLGASPGDHPTKIPETSVRLVEVISLATSIISLVALLSATAINWLRENRERKKNRLNQRLLEIRLSRENIALERDKMELDKLRSSSEKPGVATDR